MQQKQFFVSYARNDWETVENMTNELRSEGANLWLDQVDLKPGDHWDRSVEAALRSCPGFLMFLSPKSVASNNVLDEASIAVDQGKEMLLLLIDTCNIPMRLSRIQYIDFRGDRANALRQCKSRLTAGAVGPEVLQAGASEPRRILWYHPDMLKELQRLLSSYIGPVAAALVDRKSKTAASPEALVVELAASISDSSDKFDFQSTAQTLISATGVEPPANAPGFRGRDIPPAKDIDDIRAAFVPYMGPLGGHLVEKEYGKVGSRAELVAALADYIHDTDQRQEFLARISQI